MGWACGAYGWGEGVYRVLVGKPEGKRPLGRPRHRWVDNIRMNLQEVGCGYMDWTGLAQDRDRWRKLVSAEMNLRVPWNAGNFLTSCKPVSFSRRTLHHGVSKYEWVSIVKSYKYSNSRWWVDPMRGTRREGSFTGDSQRYVRYIKRDVKMPFRRVSLFIWAPLKHMAPRRQTESVTICHKQGPKTAETAGSNSVYTTDGSKD